MCIKRILNAKKNCGSSLYLFIFLLKQLMEKFVEMYSAV